MYEYKVERARLFTDEGQREFLKVRDRVHALLAAAGCVRMDKAISVVSGDSWLAMAYVDRLVELGEIVEVKPDGKDMAGQYRMFTKYEGF
jgi:hypothetical protein